MDSKLKSQRKVLAAKPKSQPKVKADTKPLTRKNGKAAEKLQMPDLVAGKEVLGRKLSVIKTTKKEAIWVKGAVKDFDEPTIRHKIKYDLPLPEVLNDSEEWLCLSKSGFMWKDDDFKCPFANPTYSSKHTPKREEAIGKRVKVFWTAMSKWYQGKVVDYDVTTGKHRVSFRDGEQNQYDLQQEALVWLDIPQLSSEAALKNMRSEEGEPVAIIRNDENQAPVERECKAAGTQCPTPATVRTPICKKKQAKTPEDLAQEGPKTRRLRKQDKSVVKTRASKDPNPSPANGSKTDVNGNATPGSKRKPADNDKSAASTVTPAPDLLSEAKTPTKESGAQQKISIVANGNGKGLSKGTPQIQVKPAAENGSRKRSRLGDTTLTNSGSAPPDAKRRAILKTGSVPAKSGRRPKAAGEESRLGLKRQKKEADIRFEECCQSVLGARVEVWWQDDHCYYKGKIVAHDWYRKKLKICYDDGVEEYISPQKEDIRFRWLTPRALTAGATDAVHAAFQTLRASNAGLPVPQPEEGLQGSESQQANTPATSAPPDAQTNSAYLADGSHLDALVPMQVNGVKAEPQQKSVGQSESVTVGPHPVDSTTRAMCIDNRTPSLLASALSGAQHLNLNASTAGLFLGLQSMLGSHGGRGLSLPQPLHGLARGLAAPLNKQLLQPTSQPAAAAVPHVSGPRPGSAASRSGSVSNVSSAPKSSVPPVQGSAAEGWKVSIVFRGDHQHYHGRILAYKAETGRHMVLWEDGEDEWVDISQEHLTWHSEKGKSYGFSAGLPEGHDIPEGEKLIGWSLAVFWKHECKFFDGVVVDYDADLDQHTIHYNDGEERCESVHSLIFKYVLPPNVQPVGARRIHPPRRWQDSGSEAEEDTAAHRRQRRRLRGQSQEDETDEEWTGGKPLPERRSTRPHIVPPIRHSSLGHHRQHCLLQQHGSLPSVRTPGSSEIRRLSSKCGSLLFFEGEDNPAISPATSPKTSPQISPPTKQESGSMETRMVSALDRKISCLKSAMGFKTGVKRVRLYMKGWPAEGEAGAASTDHESAERPKQDRPKASTAPPTVVKQEPTETADEMPNKHSLKMMLKRVELASVSMQTGTPAAMSSPTSTLAASGPDKSGSVGLPKQFSLPSTTILSTQPAGEPLPNKAAESGAVDVPVVRTQSLPLSQDQRITPPPSPFASCFQGQENGVSEDKSRSIVHSVLPEPMSSSLAGNGVYSLLSKLRGMSGGVVPGEALASPSLPPDTPSSMGEKHLLALSRTASVMSDPLLAELLQCKLLSCKGQASLEEQLGLFQPK